MTKYNPNKHHRRSIRLKGYDYSQAGLYFITICVQDHKWLFGKIENGEMILNEPGKMIEKWYYELENKFPDIKCGAMIVMPNHFHCIVQNVGIVGTVGADQRVCPCPDNSENTAQRNGNLGEQSNGISGEQRNGNLGEQRNGNLGEQSNGISGEHTGSPLRTVVQWFKTMSTNEYIRGVKTLGWMPFNGKLWQRNYYEHIIRNEQSHNTISNYIINNPANWCNDKLFK